MIPYGKQDITDADIESVVEVLKSDFLTQGPMVPRFEESISKYCNSKYVIALNSATSALHLACLSLDVGPGDIVWTSPVTFVASANCALYCNAKIDFIDIDSKTYNISIEALKNKLEQAKKNGNLPKVVIPVHLAGQSCDMEAIHNLSQQYGFNIIEDASHAIGATYKNHKIGSCKYSDITVFSFHPVKIITTGEGGVVITNNPEIAKCVQLLRSHGITRNEDEMTHISDGPWYYQQIALGFNYRMTDIQAALGLSQMQRLDEYVEKRNEIALRYNTLLEKLPVTTPWQNPETYSSYHLYIIRLNKSDVDINHKYVFECLRNADIGVNLHYIPVYRQPYYEKKGYSTKDYPESENYYAEAISLPMYPMLSDSQQIKVVDELSKILIS